MPDLHARLLAEIERREGILRMSLMPPMIERPPSMRDLIEEERTRDRAERELAYLAALRKVAEIHRDWPSTITYADGSVIEARECRVCIDGECGEICRTLRTVAEALGMSVDG